MLMADVNEITVCKGLNFGACREKTTKQQQTNKTHTQTQTNTNICVRLTSLDRKTN